MRTARTRRSDHRTGFTLVELVIAMSVMGILAGIAGSRYQKFIERARVASAVASLHGISRVLDAVQLEKRGLPETLAEVDATLTDPWGRRFEYLKIEGTLPPGHAQSTSGLPHVSSAPPADKGGGAQPEPRMDRFLVPINTDYDLYSRGADGETAKQLGNKLSRDDVIRAANGSYYGLAEGF